MPKNPEKFEPGIGEEKYNLVKCRKRRSDSSIEKRRILIGQRNL